jgi:hypothetical protein
MKPSTVAEFGGFGVLTWAAWQVSATAGHFTLAGVLLFLGMALDDRQSVLHARTTLDALSQVVRSPYRRLQAHRATQRKHKESHEIALAKASASA